MAAVHHVTDITSRRDKPEPKAEGNASGQDTAELGKKAEDTASGQETAELENRAEESESCKHLIQSKKQAGEATLVEDEITRSEKGGSIDNVVEAFEKCSLVEKTPVTIKGACSTDEIALKTTKDFSAKADTSDPRRKVNILIVRRAWEKYVIDQIICNPPENQDLDALSKDDELLGIKEFIDLANEIISRRIDCLTQDPDKIMLEEFTPSEYPLRDFAIQQFHRNISIYKRVVVVKTFIEVYPYSGTSCELPQPIELLPDWFFNTIDDIIENKYLNIKVDVIEEMDARKLPESAEDVPAIMKHLWDHVKEHVYMLVFLSDHLVESCMKIKQPMTGYHTIKCLDTLHYFYSKLRYYAEEIIAKRKELINPVFKQLSYIMRVMIQVGLISNELWQSLQTLNTTKEEEYGLRS